MVYLEAITSKVGIKGKCVLRFRFAFKGKNYYLYPNESVISEYWDNENKTIKQKHPNYKFLTKRISIKREIIENAIEEAKTLQVIDIKSFCNDKLQEWINEGLSAEQRTEKKHGKIPDFFETYQMYIEFSKTQISNQTSFVRTSSTISNNEYNLSFLKKFEKDCDYKLTFESINDSFYEIFKNYILFKLNNKQNTFNARIKLLKSFLNYSTKIYKGKYNVPQYFNEFKIYNVTETGVDYLRPDELKILRELYIENKVIDKVRNVLLFQCGLGLRHRDIQEFNSKYIDFENEIIVLEASKTRKKVFIPFFDDEYLQPVTYYNKIKLDNGKIISFSTVQYNTHLKTLQKLAEIDRIVLKGHVARKTFVTINEMYRNVDPSDIRLSTGHTTEKSYQKYAGVNIKSLVDRFKRK